MCKIDKQELISMKFSHSVHTTINDSISSISSSVVNNLVHIIAVKFRAVLYLNYTLDGDTCFRMIDSNCQFCVLAVSNEAKEAIVIFNFGCAEIHRTIELRLVYHVFGGY